MELFNGPHLIVYASTEAHMCVGKALELLGFGSKAMHLIPVDENFCIKIDELKKTIEEDRLKWFNSILYYWKCRYNLVLIVLLN